jgi:hypothetical protein
MNKGFILLGKERFYEGITCSGKTGQSFKKETNYYAAAGVHFGGIACRDSHYCLVDGDIAAKLKQGKAVGILRQNKWQSA